MAVEHGHQQIGGHITGQGIEADDIGHQQRGRSPFAVLRHPHLAGHHPFGHFGRHDLAEALALERFAGDALGHLRVADEHRGFVGHVGEQVEIPFTERGIGVFFFDQDDAHQFLFVHDGHRQTRVGR